MSIHKMLRTLAVPYYVNMAACPLVTVVAVIANKTFTGAIVGLFVLATLAQPLFFDVGKFERELCAPDSTDPIILLGLRYGLLWFTTYNLTMLGIIFFYLVQPYI
jgi:hypothetical protein